MIGMTIYWPISAPTDRHKMVYGIEMTLPLDLMLGDTGPEQAIDECPYVYVEILGVL